MAYAEIDITQRSNITHTNITWSRMGKSPLVMSPNDWVASASNGADKTALTFTIPPPPPALCFSPWIRSLTPPQLKKDPLPLAVLSDEKELFVSKMLEMSWCGSSKCWHPNRADVVIAPNLHRTCGRGKLVRCSFASQNPTALLSNYVALSQIVRRKNYLALGEVFKKRCNSRSLSPRGVDGWIHSVIFILSLFIRHMMQHWQTSKVYEWPGTNFIH